MVKNIFFLKSDTFFHTNSQDIDVALFLSAILYMGF